MKPFMALLLVLCLALAAIPAAADAPELTIVEENFYLRKNYGEKFDGIYIAKLRNDTETPLYIDSCTLVLTDAEGGEAGKQDFLSVRPDLMIRRLAEKKQTQSDQELACIQKLPRR